MTQLSMGVAALNHDSKFADAYERGLPKADYWKPAFDDALDLIAKLPVLAARIYNNLYRDGTPVPQVDSSLDLIGSIIHFS
jgi:citrate synthase